MIQAAAVKASTERFHVATLSYWNLVTEEMRQLSAQDGGSIGHAGEMETSLQLHLQPEFVDLGAVAADECLDLGTRAAIQAQGCTCRRTRDGSLRTACTGCLTRVVLRRRRRW